MTRWLIASLSITAIALAVALGLGLGFPEVLRERIPTHWDVHMNPDHWVDREDFIWQMLIFPGVMALMTLLMWGLPYLSPKNFEVERFARTWGYIFTVLVAFFGYLFALMVWMAISEHAWFERPFIAGFFVMFGLMGNQIGKVQRNFWMGVRTPWTLASDAVWVRTHRHAAWLWTATGAIGAVMVLVGVPFWIPLVVLMAAAFWPVLYSLILYKRLQREGQV